MLADTKLRSLKPKASPFRVSDANGLYIEVRHREPRSGVTAIAN